MALRIVDPLAQSFFIEEPCVITKADLYFATKDDNIPVNVQIRKNENGQPGRLIMPFSEAIIHPSSISTSTNSNVATTVTFSSPVFLDAGEYSLAIYSGSKNYRVFVSELGETDILTDKRISEQPLVGSLFKSQNASEWTPVQTEDLKFNLYRAEFSSGVTGVVDFLPQPNSYRKKLLETDPLELFSNSDILRVYHPDHFMQDGSYVVLNGIANVTVFGNVSNINSFYGIDGNVIDGIYYEISNATTDSYTIVLPNRANTYPYSSVRFGGPAVSASQDLRYETIYPAISLVNQDGTVAYKYKGTSTAYTKDSSFTTLSKGDNDLLTSDILPSNVNIQTQMSNVDPSVFRIELTTNNSKISPLIDTKQIGLVLATNLIDSPTYASVTSPFDISTVCQTASANVTQLTGNIGLLTLAVAADQANARGLVKGTLLTISNTNPNNGTFRVVDVLDNGANVKIFNTSANVVTDVSANVYTVVSGSKFIAEEAATGGTTTSKYITRQIDFVNPSTSINFRLDVSKPQGASLEFYAKTKLVGETEILSNKEYFRLDDPTIPTALGGEFYEITKQIDNLEAFDGIIFKIVLKSTNPAAVPKIKNLRLLVLE